MVFLIPYYAQMVKAIVNVIPFEYSTAIEIIDLGFEFNKILN